MRIDQIRSEKKTYCECFLTDCIYVTLEVLWSSQVDTR